MGLDSGTVVAPGDPVHFEGRHAPNPFHDFNWIGHAKRLELMILLERLRAESGLLQVADFGFRRLDDVVVEAWNLNPNRK